MYRSDKQFMKNPATASSRIYVGNIAESVVAADLEEKFRGHGKILGLVLQRGFGFIQFENEHQAQSAIRADHGCFFHGKKLVVQQAVEKARVSKGPQPFQSPHNQQQQQQQVYHQQQHYQQPQQQQLHQQPQLQQHTPTPPPTSGFQGPQHPPPLIKQEPQISPLKIDASLSNDGSMNQSLDDEMGHNVGGTLDGSPDESVGGGGIGLGLRGLGPDRRRRGRRGGGPRNRENDRDWHRESHDRFAADDFHSSASSRDMSQNVPSRDISSRDMPPRDIPPRDMPPRDIPPRDMPPRDMPPRDMPPRDMPPRDMPPRDMPPRDMPPRDVPPPYFGREDPYRPGFVPPPIIDRPERNDCEIIVVSRLLTEYAEYIEQRLKSLGLVVDLLYPNEDVPIGRVLANISSRGCLYAILVMPQNEEFRSLTLNVLHGLPQEHRNIPLEDAFNLITRNFDAYMRGEKMTFNTPGSNMMTLNDRHPEQMQMLLNLLAENRQLTRVQYDRVIKYLQERRELQQQFEIAEGGSEVASEPQTDSKQAELQSRIMNILNKSADEVPKPVEPPSAQPGATPLLKDPSVQKALDSLLSGDMFKSIAANL